MKYLSVILIIILSFALVQVQARTLKHLYDWGHYNSNSYPPSNQLQPDWISRVVPGLPVSVLSIPGTHDSGTFPGNGGDFAQCQSWNTYDQLRAGIRFLDIRFDYTYVPFIGKIILSIYHGHQLQIELKSQLKSIKRFLSQHPNEFVIMLLAQENGSYKEGNLKAIESLFDQIQFPYYYSPQIPRVQQIRGKVWIMLNSASFPDYMKQKTFWYQNSQTLYKQYPKYHLQNQWQASVDQKVRSAKSLIDRNCDGKLKLNWLNKAYNGRFPFDFARQDGGTNESIERYFKDYRRRCIGILIMDFPGANLIRLIIANNWFYR